MTDQSKTIEDRQEDLTSSVSSWFIGPRGENAKFCAEQIQQIFDHYSAWRRSFAAGDSQVLSARDKADRPFYGILSDECEDLARQFTHHYPFFSPRYIGHMLSDQTLPAILGYMFGMLFNANNVTDEAAPVTVRLELEVAESICAMLGYPNARSWAHLCSGGTIANLEALWVARSVQFLPLLIRQYVEATNLRLDVTTPNAREDEIRNVPWPTLACLKPRIALNLFDKLIRIGERQGIVQIREDFAQFAKDGESDYTKTAISENEKGKFNIRRNGIGAVLASLHMTPRIFVSAAAHYSVLKAVNILGYGESTVKEVPVTNRFRIDIAELENQLYSLPEDKYVAAVIGIAGTTEEGAVDPIREIIELRKKYEKEKNRSFWIHVDAAWGGYIRSLFRDSKGNEPLFPISRQEKLPSKYVAYQGMSGLLSWGDQGDQELLDAFRSIPQADSITVDPHKLGYIPYPAGLIAFRDRRALELIKRDANYIFGSTPKSKSDPTSKSDSTAAIGPYIIEGSKPGASAVSCWLAHRTIPLNRDGHGVLIRESLLNARLLACYLNNHRYTATKLETLTRSSRPNSLESFTFVPICWPDTNVVAFIAKPVSRATHDGSQVAPTIVQPLDWLNEFNRRIYQGFSIEALKHKTQNTGQVLVSEEDEERSDEIIEKAQQEEDEVESLESTPIQTKPFFLSSTSFDHVHYSYASLSRLFRLLDYDEKKHDCAEQYKKHGLFVIRATIMNPYYQAYRESQGRDLLFDFLKELHKRARAVLQEMPLVLKKPWGLNA